MTEIMRCYFLFAAGLLLTPLTSSAQRSVVVSGEYIYYVPKNISLDQAERIAVERAQIQLIADEFGTIVEAFTTAKISNTNGVSQVSTSTLGSSEVRGEWIETLGEPTIEPSYEDGMLVVHVSIKGRIREIVSAPVDFKAKILRNGTDDRFEQSEFCHGDDMYLSFSSPVKGYLTIYLFDGDDQVYCLLPYQRQSEGMVEIDANKRYVFFSRDLTPKSIDKQLVDEYNLTASRDDEYNRVYIVFSTKKFFKAEDNENVGADIPRSLSFSAFQNWLTKNKKRDTDLRFEIKDILIHKQS